jgi:hypothetical protein
VTVRLVVRAMEIIDSIGLLVVSVLARRPSMPRRATVNISSRPLRMEAAAPGSSSRAGRRGAGVAQSLVWVRVGEDLDQLGVDPVFLLVRQVVGGLAPLVQGAALHQGFVAEHPVHRGGQCLRAVDGDQQPVGDAQAARDQVGQQRGDYGLCYRWNRPTPDRDLGAVGGVLGRRAAVCAWLARTVAMTCSTTAALASRLSASSASVAHSRVACERLLDQATELSISA